MSTKHFNEMVATTGCVLRGGSDLRDAMPFENFGDMRKQKRIYIGDSWFGSVKSAAALSLSGDHCVMAVKTGHARLSKAFLENKMKTYPGGTWLVMEGNTEKEGVNLVAIG